jgi:hypothetical protein
VDLRRTLRGVPDAFRAFFEGDIVGILVILVVAAVMDLVLESEGPARERLTDFEG